jgi:hypothetical protein
MPPTSTKRIDLSSKKQTQKQLLKLAAQHNLEQLGTADPTQDTLRGIAEVAKLRPGAQPAYAFSLGSVPADSPYAKAWRSVKRVPKQAGATEPSLKVWQKDATKGASSCVRVWKRGQLDVRYTVL